MDQAKDVAEDGLVVGILLEPDQLHVDSIEVFCSLGEKLY